MNIAEILKNRQDILDEVVSENFVGLMEVWWQFEDFQIEQWIERTSRQLLSRTEYEW